MAETVENEEAAQILRRSLGNNHNLGSTTFT